MEHILIADQDEGFLKELSTFLKNRGYKTQSTTSGRQALRVMQNGFDPDVIVMGVSMRELDGMTVAREIRKNDQVFVAPIIFVGDVADYSTFEEAYQSGAADFLSKPINYNELILKIQNYIHARNVYKKIKEEAIKDPLTQLFNRRFVDEKLKIELARCRRYGHLLSILIIDIDKFKTINDLHGHQYGDIALRETASILRSYCRGSDILGRYGGDEFIMILNGVNTSGAKMVADRILKRIAQLQIKSKTGRTPLSLSMGGVDITIRKDLSPRDIIKYADMALYRSKEKGGGCITFWHEAKKALEKKNLLEEKIIEKYTKRVLTISRKAKQAYIEGVVQSLIKAVELKDGFTARHSLRVAETAKDLAKRLGFKSEFLSTIEHAAKLCDVGKIGLPDNLLEKKGKYTKADLELMNQHSLFSHKILKSSGFLTEELPMILGHHERFDGSGYPHQLKGDQIPIGARILSVSDAFCAMTSDRPYRKAMSLQKAKNEILKNKGKQFDPKIADAFIKIAK